MDISIPHGDKRTFAIAITAGGTPLPLTGGKTLRFQAKRTHDQVTALIAKATGSGITHDPDQGANPGKATLALDPADTSALPNRRTILVFDVEVDDGADPFTAISGTLEIRPEVARP
jgi:hypothetical protein